MDIHPPSGSVHTVKDFFVHLSMIVIGILIAVGLDQAVEWRHHRLLVEEAKANIASEMRDNRKELAGTLSTYSATEKQLTGLLDVIKQLRKHRSTNNLSASLSVHLSQLSIASRSSAEAIGALAYMEYADVKRLAGVYDLQQQFLRVQERLLDSVTLALAGLQEDPTKESDAELDATAAHAKAALANLSVSMSFGKALSKAYEEALKPER